VKAGDVHAMHDPTEGGLATGLWELAEAAQVGLAIDEAAIPVFEETAALCRALHLDPLGLIASGALLLAVAPSDADDVCAALEEDGIATARIGRIVEREKGKTLRSAGQERPLPKFERDEIARLFE
jgi:hydrogenase maturation factor